MTRIILICITFLFISGCGTTKTETVKPSIKKTPPLPPVKHIKLGHKKYKIDAGGDAFTPARDIVLRTKREANKLCGKNNYMVKTDYQALRSVPSSSTASSASGETVIMCK